MKWVDVYSKYCTRLNHANVTERSIKYIHYFYQLIYSLIGQLVFRSHDFILLFLFRLQATPSSNSTPLSICNIVKSPGQFFFAVLYNFVNNVTMNSKGCEKKTHSIFVGDEIFKSNVLMKTSCKEELRF